MVTENTFKNPQEISPESLLFDEADQRALRASVIGTADSLSLVTSLRTQNLVFPALELYWKHQRGLFFSLGYNGQFGKWYRNNELAAKLGLSF